MTDTADRTESVSQSVLPGVGDGAEAPARRRSGSLSAMLLPELQQLAGSMGISTAKKKKSDLVAAIQAHRAGGDGGSGTRAAAPATAPAAAPAAATAPAAVESAPSAAGSDPAATAPSRTRTRRAATRPTAAADTATADATPVSSSAPVDGSAVTTSEPAARADAPAVGDAPARSERPARGRRDDAARDDRSGGDASGRGQNGTRPDRDGGSNRQDRQDRQNTQDRDGGGNNRQDRQDRQNNQDRDGGGNNRQDRQDRQNNQDRDGGGNNRQDRQDRQNNQDRDGGGNNRQNNQDRQNNRDGNRQNGNDRRDDRRDDRDDDFDDDGTGRRRGRRYRDRNRNRNRDRQGGGNENTGGGNDREPAVADDDVLVPIAGIVDEIVDKNTWFVRVNGYFASTDDIYVQNSFVRRYNLRRGDAVTGAVRQLRDGERREKYNPLVRLDTVNGAPPNEAGKRPEFTKLTPLYPQQRLRLETEQNVITTRVIDLVMPIGKGQRALIVSPPKAGKTMVLQAIANAITTNNPECHLMVVLVDERPEEVTDMQRSVKGEVIASTFDRRPQEHTMVAELSIERAKRLVEMGHDVVVLLDSITRLGRAYNLAAPTSGRILSGGVDSSALYPPKRFLGAARNIENGGSLTIIATALVETGSAGDTVIFEEYKGTGNAELKLDRKIADKRVFPAVDVDQSSTRKEELLLAPDEFQVVMKLRRVLHALDPQQAIDLLTDRLKKSRNNYEFLMQIAKTTPGGSD